MNRLDKIIITVLEKIYYWPVVGKLSEMAFDRLYPGHPYSHYRILFKENKNKGFRKFLDNANETETMEIIKRSNELLKAVRKTER